MTDASGRSVTAEEIQQWVIDKLVQQMHVNPADVELDKRLANYGIDSLQMISLVGQMEEWLDCRFLANPLERHPSIRALSEFVAGQLADRRREINPSA